MYIYICITHITYCAHPSSLQGTSFSQSKNAMASASLRGPFPLHVFRGHRGIVKFSCHVAAVIAAGIDSEVVFILVGTVKNLWLDTFVIL